MKDDLHFINLLLNKSEGIKVLDSTICIQYLTHISDNLVPIACHFSSNQPHFTNAPESLYCPTAQGQVSLRNTLLQQ